MYYTFYVGFVYGWMWHVFPLFPNPYLSNAHSWFPLFVGLIGLIIYVKASTSNPGYVTRENVLAYENKYEYDSILFEADVECATCNLIKPARSKHCSTCGRCVARFDHHCIWINNCVGVNNLKYFLGFLYWHAGIMVYGLYLAPFLVRHVCDQAGLDYVRVQTPSGKKPLASLDYVIYFIILYPGYVFFIAIGVVIFFMFGSFATYHVWLVIRNNTTNECFKQDQYQDWRERKEQELKERIERGEKIREDEIPLKSPPNIYRRSPWWRNLPEIWEDPIKEWQTKRVQETLRKTNRENTNTTSSSGKKQKKKKQ